MDGEWRGMSMALNDADSGLEQRADETAIAVMDGAPVRVLVGICTFRRPDGLRALLKGVACQQFTQVARPHVGVLVVDNDCDPTIEALTAVLATDLALDVRYVGESRRGIAQARNAVLAGLADDADWLLFIDDDEVPRVNWLEEMLVATQKSNAVGVSGLVLAGAVPGYPRWVRDGRFFTSPRGKRDADYDDVAFGVMGNFMVNAVFLRRHGLRFDERLGLVGSEDKAFFGALRKLGGGMTYTSRAVAEHFVPASRATLRYLLLREFRVGCGRGLALRFSRPGATAYAAFVTRALLRLITDTLMLPATTLMGLLSHNRFDRMRPMFKVVQWAGRLYGVVGMRYEQYLKD